MNKDSVVARLRFSMRSNSSSRHTALSEYKMASMIQERHLQRETLIWVQAENSKIDPGKDPLPLVMFEPLCRFRPICLDTLHKAGRTREILYNRVSPSAA